MSTGSMIDVIEDASDFLDYFDKMTPHLALLGTVLGIDDYATATLEGPGPPQTKCLAILRHWLNVTPDSTWKLFCDQLEKKDTFNNLRARVAQDHGVSGHLLKMGDNQPLSDNRLRSIEFLSPQLESKLIVDNIRSWLFVEAGGFLNEVEMISVFSGNTRVDHVRALLDVLKMKDDRAFGSFCTILEITGYGHWSRELQMQAGLEYQGTKAPQPQEQLPIVQPLGSKSEPGSYRNVRAEDVIALLDWDDLIRDIKNMLTSARLNSLKRSFKLIGDTCAREILRDLDGDPDSAATTLLVYFENNHSGDDLMKFCGFLRNESDGAGLASALVDLAEKIEDAVKCKSSQGSMPNMEDYQPHGSVQLKKPTSTIPDFLKEEIIKPGKGKEESATEEDSLHIEVKSSQPDMGDNQRDSVVQVMKPTSTIQDVLKGEIRKTKGYQKVLRNMVAKHIGLHLDALANNLEVDSGGFVANHPHNKKDAAAALLIHWAEENTGQTPIWSDLLEAMRESHMAKEANELEEYLRGEVETNKTQPLQPPVKYTKDKEITMDPLSSPPALSLEINYPEQVTDEGDKGELVPSQEKRYSGQVMEWGAESKLVPSPNKVYSLPGIWDAKSQLLTDYFGDDLSAQLGEEYKAVVEQNACITLQISKCTTIGPPRVGKTCLKYLLIGQKWDKGPDSTDVMEAPEWVEVFLKDEHEWIHLHRETRKHNLIHDMVLRNYDEDNKSKVDEDQTSVCGDKQTVGDLDETVEGVEKTEGSRDVDKTVGDAKKTGGDIEKTGGDVEKTGGNAEMTEGDVQETGEGVEKTGRDVKKTEVDVEKTGGDAEKTGGEVKKTAGDVKKTGGDVKKTGGEVKKTAGDVKKTAGDVKKTGGDLKKTAGDVKKTGGDVKETGGEVRKTAGDVKKTGGDVKKTGEDAENTGRDAEKTGGDVEKMGGNVQKAGRDAEKTGDVEKTGDAEKTGRDVEKTAGDVLKTADVEKNRGDVEKTTQTHLASSKKIRELQSSYEKECIRQKLDEAQKESKETKKNPKGTMKTRKFLHFVDTGGQRIYHDVHPVLITSPSVYLVVINLVDSAREHGILTKHPEELGNDISPTPYHEREPISSSKQSSMATKIEDVGTQKAHSSFMNKDPEAMNLAERALRSIQTFTNKRSGEGKYFKIQPRQPKVFIVGTHLDRICPNDSAEQQRVLDHLHQSLECKIQEKSYFQFIQYDDKLRCFWAVDNTLAGDKKLQERDPKMYQYLRLLRSLIQEQSMMFNVKIPVKWQLFEHLTCQQSHFQYRELLDFALDKKFVENRKEFDSMLRVFHILSLYYFRVPHMYAEQSTETFQSPRDTAIIFTKPDALYKATTELLKSAKITGDKMVDVKSHLDRLISSNEIVDIDRDWFAGLLCDLRLMAVGKSSHEFIIPAALPARGKNMEESNADFSVGSLLVTFFSPQSHESFIPSGLFCALVSEVLTFPEFKSKLKYLHRDCIVVSVSEFDLQCGDLYIIERDVYIEIAFRTTTKDGLKTLAELSRKCNDIRKFLHRRINVVWRRIYQEQSSEILRDPSISPKDLKAITWGFPCVHHPEGAHISEYQEDEMMFCASCLGCTSSLIQEVSPKQQVWFQSLTGELLKTEGSSLLVVEDTI